MRVYKFNIKGSSGRWYLLTIKLTEKIKCICECKSSYKRCRHATEVLANVSKNLDEDGTIMQSEMVEYLMSSPYGIEIINKSRLFIGLSPFCNQCGQIMSAVNDSWLKQLISFKKKALKFICLHCNNNNDSLPLEP